MNRARPGHTRCADGSQMSAARGPERLERRDLLATDTILDFSIPADLPEGHHVFVAIWGTENDTATNQRVLQPKAGSQGSFEFVVNPASPTVIDVSKLTGNQITLPLSDVETGSYGGITGGEVVIFVAPSATPPAFPLNASNVATVPTVTTYPDTLFTLFEWAYVEGGSGSYGLDIDLSEVDQIGFPISVATTPSSAAPFPLSVVGMAPSREGLTDRYLETFDTTSPFHELVALGGGYRILAPQTALGQQNGQGPAPGHSVTPGTSPFPQDVPFWYLVTAMSDTGETIAGAAAATAISMNGFASATLTWPPNPSPRTTGYRLYRGQGTVEGSESSATPIPPANLSDYELVYEGPKLTFTDTYVPKINDDTPPLNSYAFDPLSTYYTASLNSFFTHYESHPFEIVVPNIGPDKAGTKWQGTVATDYQAVAHENVAGPGSTATTIVLDVAALPIAGIYDGLSVTINPDTPTAQTRTVQSSSYDPVAGRQTLSFASPWTSPPAAGTPYEIVGTYTALVLTAADGYLHDVGDGSQSASFAILKPLFSTNTKGISGLSPMPDWVLDGGGQLGNYTMSPSQMVFGQLGVFASNAIDPAIPAANGFLTATQLTDLKTMVGAIENAISTAFNRGLATRFDLAPDAWVTNQSFTSQPASAKSAAGPGDLVAGTTYYYVMTAVDAAGNESTPGLMVAGKVAQGDDGLSLAFAPIPATAPTGPAYQGSVYASFNVYRSTTPDLSSMKKLYVLANRTTPGFGSFTDFGTGYDYAAGPSPQPQVTPITNPSQQVAPPHVFYPAGSTSNLYSQFLHRNATFDPASGVSINGLVYGFPYDDNGGNSTNIGYTAGANPTKLTVTINPWTEVPRFVSGDFNGDGLTDVASRDGGTGIWTAWLTSTTAGEPPTQVAMATWPTSEIWSDFLVGDFTGDGTADIAGRNTHGAWQVISKAGGTAAAPTFVSQLWITGQPTVRDLGDLVVGDFDGDDRDDIAGRRPNGTWWFIHQQGGSIVASPMARWTTNMAWSMVVVGNFTGDASGREQIAGRNSNGVWWMISYDSSLSAFTNTSMTPWSKAFTWADAVVGDFTGDGRDDIAARRLYNNSDPSKKLNSWFVITRPDTTFQTSNIGKWPGNQTWLDIRSGDFLGNGLAGIAGRSASTGDWQVLQKSGSSYASTNFGGGWSPAGNSWQVFAGLFNAADTGPNKKTGLLGRAMAGNWVVSLSNGSSFATTPVTFS